MRVFDIFKKKTSVNKKELIKLMKAADEAPAQLEKLGKQMEELEARLIQEIHEGCAKLLEK